MRKLGSIRSLLPIAAAALLACTASAATVVVVQFQNKSEYSDLNWVGESIPDRLLTEFAANGEIVPTRSERDEGEKRLSLRPGADYTEATLIRLGQTLDADVVCFGSFTVTLPAPDAELKDSSIRITAEFLDLGKMHLGPELSEAGKLADLSRLEEHLAYEAMKYLDPKANLQLDRFLTPQKTIRLEAEESYTRGLMSANRDQRQKWFLQAVAIDPKFSEAAYELGRLSIDAKQYPQALDWLSRVTPSDRNYEQARFKMGIAAYNTGDYSAAAKYFRDLVQTYPLSEVYNNLGAAENETGSASAVADFRHALESDPNSATYLFNLGTAQLRTGSFEDAAQSFQQILQHSDDPDARSLLERARKKEPLAAGEKLPAQRLKASFSETAFRQLKAMLQPKKE